MNEIPKPTPMREIDFTFFIRHYVSLAWKWKLWIILAGPIVSGIALVYVMKFASLDPALTANVKIGLESSTNMSAMIMGDMVGVDNGKAELIKSRNLLKEVVKELSLNFYVKKYARTLLFDTIVIDTIARIGKYEFMLDKDNVGSYLIKYTNKRSGFKNKIVETGKLATIEKIDLPGISLLVSRTFKNEPHDFTFSILNEHVAIEHLRKNIVVKAPNPRRQQYHIEVIMEGLDYQLTPQILNTIADEFIEKNLMYRKRKTQRGLHALKKQLDRSRNDLAISENQLKRYRSSNPTIGLTQNAQQTVDNLIGMETQVNSIKSNSSEARGLLNKYNSSFSDERKQVAGEILMFLNSKGNSSAALYQSELNRLQSEKRVLDQNYAETHPVIIENNSEIDKILNKVVSELNLFISKTGDEVIQKALTIQNLSDKLKRLPSKQLQMTELQRKQQIGSDIYSRVLDRYNQAKVAETVEVADVYIMDYAVPPIPPPTNMLQLLGICIALGLGVAFGPMVLLDFVNKTVATEFELAKIIDLPILESIPKIVTKSSVNKKRDNTNTEDIVNEKNVSSDIEKNIKTKNKDAKKQNLLLTSVYKQEYIKELFRSLRTKVLMDLHGHIQDKNIIVTSLDANVGKSTISSNIAIASAQQNLKTILIDGDLRKGSLDKIFDIEFDKKDGLAGFLSIKGPLSENPFVSLIKKTHVDNLFIIPSGEYVDNPSELLTSERFFQLKKFLTEHFDIIIMDTPPIGVAIDAIAVNELFSKYIIVVKAGVTNVVDLKKKIKEFSAIKSKIMGLVLNYTAIDKKLSYYKYSKYYR